MCGYDDKCGSINLCCPLWEMQVMNGGITGFLRVIHRILNDVFDVSSGGMI
jgi:hypothetical protein